MTTAHEDAAQDTATEATLLAELAAVLTNGNPDDASDTLALAYEILAAVGRMMCEKDGRE